MSDGTSDRGRTNANAADFGPKDELRSSELDSMFEALSVARRRYVLYYLADRPDEAVDLVDLIDHVRMVEQAEGTAETTRQERIRIDLHHSHLPKLDAMGVIDYDGRSGTVRYRSRPTFEDWLDRARRDESG